MQSILGERVVLHADLDPHDEPQAFFTNFVKALEW